MITMRRSSSSARQCTASPRVMTNTSSCPSRIRRQSRTLSLTMARTIFTGVLGPIRPGSLIVLVPVVMVVAMIMIMVMIVVVMRVGRSLSQVGLERPLDPRHLDAEAREGRFQLGDVEDAHEPLPDLGRDVAVAQDVP